MHVTQALISENVLSQGCSLEKWLLDQVNNSVLVVYLSWHEYTTLKNKTKMLPPETDHPELNQDKCETGF